VLTAADGREALRLVDQAGNRVDLLLSDIVMPGLGGRELVWHLRARIPDLRVILASGYTDAGGALQMLEEDHETMFVSKPVDLRVLLEMVKEAIGD
jgi:CheY-like chemotaxis protein